MVDFINEVLHENAKLLIDVWTKNRTYHDGVDMNYLDILINSHRSMIMTKELAKKKLEIKIYIQNSMNMSPVCMKHLK